MGVVEGSLEAKFRDLFIKIKISEKIIYWGPGAEFGHNKLKSSFLA